MPDFILNPANIATANLGDTFSGGTLELVILSNGIRGTRPVSQLISSESQAEQDQDIDALEIGKLNIADRVSTIRDAANAEDDKVVSELAIRTLVDSIATEGILTDFDDITEKAIAKTWKAETLDERYHPMPLPATGATLDSGKVYYGRGGTYTLNAPAAGEETWLYVINFSNLKTEADPISVTGKYAFSADGTIFNLSLIHI